MKNENIKVSKESVEWAIRVLLKTVPHALDSVGPEVKKVLKAAAKHGIGVPQAREPAFHEKYQGADQYIL